MASSADSIRLSSWLISSVYGWGEARSEAELLRVANGAFRDMEKDSGV